VTWTEKYLKPLEGLKVVKTGQSPDGFPKIVFEGKSKMTGKKERFECEVSQDGEGNGPGFIFGLPRPTE
jgi:hypothetical protein